MGRRSQRGHDLSPPGGRKSGRKLILVTGRELDDLIKVFPRIDLFDRVVAENGALLYRPATREETASCSQAARRVLAAAHQKEAPIEYPSAG